MIFLAVFLIILSNAIFLYLGWYMGINTDTNVLMSKPRKKEEYEEKPDVFEQERLDFD